MNQSAAIAPPANSASAAHELFALTDEQILEIEPTSELSSEKLSTVPGSAEAAKSNTTAGTPKADSSLALGMTTGVSGAAEPPEWLARQMKDPWVGDEARELWDGVLRAQAEAAEYRAAIATPAEAKLLKEIYPGGAEQARAAAERARALDEFDAAYFGAVGKSAEETAVARTALAQRMLREDPAAFQEMVAAGVEAIKAANTGPPRPVQVGFGATSSEAVQNAARQDAGLKPGATQPSPAASAAQEAQLAAYGEFEKAANAELEKSVGGAIERALRQALPLAELSSHKNAQAGLPALQERIGGAVRQEIERALQSDRQLGEQVAQVLSARRFDESSRAQVVRLINERAQQLVPSATKRVLSDWTQTTLAAHRSKTEKQEAASQRADLAPAQQGRERTATASQQRTASRVDAPSSPRGRVDYKKLTDEQILDL